MKNKNEVKGVKYDLAPPQVFFMSREFFQKLLLGLNSSIFNDIYMYIHINRLANHINILRPKGGVN